MDHHSSILRTICLKSLLLLVNMGIEGCLFIDWGYCSWCVYCEKSCSSASCEVLFHLHVSCQISSISRAMPYVSKRDRGKLGWNLVNSHFWNTPYTFGMCVFFQHSDKVALNQIKQWTWTFFFSFCKKQRKNV